MGLPVLSKAPRAVALPVVVAFGFPVEDPEAFAAVDRFYFVDQIGDKGLTDGRLVGGIPTSTTMTGLL